ncbi:MAG: UTRA domain-containing protein [Streptomyces sp.]|nr:UTRA domain-containing protein [Streptomyces sp.]
MTDFEPILRDANRRLSAELRGAGQSVWSADVGDRDLHVELSWVGLNDSAPPAGAADLLGTDRLLVRDRTYVVDGRRICWARNYFDYDLVSGTAIAEPDSRPGGVHARLAELGLEPVAFVEDVEFAAAASGSEMRELKDYSRPLMVRITRRALTVEERVVEVADMRLVASAYVFRWAWKNA